MILLPSAAANAEGIQSVNEVEAMIRQKARDYQRGLLEDLPADTHRWTPWNRKFRVLDIIDDSNRVAVAQKIAHSMPAVRLIRLLEEIIWEKGKPNNIRCDNGPEFILHEFRNWRKGNDIKILYTQAGCPT